MDECHKGAVMHTKRIHKDVGMDFLLVIRGKGESFNRMCETLVCLPLKHLYNHDKKVKIPTIC